ncbi:uridine kinase family protein [Salinispora arenicola]|nr:hypothetical protein [Salinispora arenicola]MCN0154081.1 hypothetical protein [Salinispora arenicola]
MGHQPIMPLRVATRGRTASATGTTARTGDGARRRGPCRPLRAVRAGRYRRSVVVAVMESYALLARRVGAAPARLGRTRLVAVDGPSGAGKSWFTARLADALAGLPNSARPAVVHTDDLLEGWADQFTFWQRLEEGVLAPVRAGRAGEYRRFSWVRREFLPRPVPVPVSPVLLLEGVSAARATAAPELSLAVYVTAPAQLRLTRAVARDGPGILPELRRWHAGERAHFTADRTADRADLVVDGAPELPHDRARYYLRRGRPAVPAYDAGHDHTDHVRF